MSIVNELDALSKGARDPFGEQMGRAGLTLAKVSNIKDDKNLNRVKCIPIGSEDEEETDWCYVMTPMGGKECGMFFFPQVDDLVVLAYLDNDPNRPLVIGSYWNTEVKPPYKIKDAKVEDYSIRTPQKIELLFHDEKKKQKVTLTMPSGTVVTIDDEKEQVSIKDKGGDNALTMDLKGGEVTLQAKTKLTLSAGKTQIVLESSGNIKEKGSAKISVEGANIEAKASAGLKLQGATADLKANGTMNLNASGPATLKGAMVKIN